MPGLPITALFRQHVATTPKSSRAAIVRGIQPSWHDLRMILTFCA
jgi:hypothetical protein